MLHVKAHIGYCIPNLGDKKYGLGVDIFCGHVSVVFLINNPITVTFISFLDVTISLVSYLAFLPDLVLMIISHARAFTCVWLCPLILLLWLI